jgi:hypothetical protein
MKKSICKARVADLKTALEEYMQKNNANLAKKSPWFSL